MLQELSIFSITANYIENNKSMIFSWTLFLEKYKIVSQIFSLYSICRKTIIVSIIILSFDIFATNTIIFRKKKYWWNFKVGKTQQNYGLKWGVSFAVGTYRGGGVLHELAHMQKNIKRPNILHHHWLGHIIQLWYLAVTDNLNHACIHGQPKSYPWPRFINYSSHLYMRTFKKKSSMVDCSSVTPSF